jgi:hypothetical protein
MYSHCCFQDVYGDTIVVERTIRGDSSTSYKLKTGEGLVVAARREELTLLLEHFNIQVRFWCVSFKKLTGANW